MEREPEPSPRARFTAPFVVGLDIGTGSCKATVVDATGRFRSSAAGEHTTHRPRPGWSEQDPEEWLIALRAATAKALATAAVAPSQVKGIAFSTCAHVGVLLDRDDRPVRRAIMWNDQRSAQEVRALEATHGEEVFRTTLQKVSTTWTLPHLAWVRANDPDAWSAARRLVLSKDYVVFRLTGRIVTDPATALSSQLWDARERRWSESLCALVGLRAGDLPPAAAPTAVVDHLTREGSDLLGLPEGTPVVNGTLDSAAETFAAGLLAPGDCLIRLATAGGLHLVLAEPRPHPQLITYYHPVGSLWFCQAGTNSCASAVRWAVETFTAGNELDYAGWDALATQTPPGAEGLLFHPYLNGERCPYWDPELRASFIGASAKHGTGHFARSVYEGTAFSIRDALTVLDGLGVAYNGFTAVGGGTASSFWLQILSEVLGRQLAVAPEADSSYGAALLALVGLGYLASAEEAATIAGGAARPRVVPDEANSELYARLFEEYRAVQRLLAPFYHGREG